MERPCPPEQKPLFVSGSPFWLIEGGPEFENHLYNVHKYKWKGLVFIKLYCNKNTNYFYIIANHTCGLTYTGKLLKYDYGI